MTEPAQEYTHEFASAIVGPLLRANTDSVPVTSCFRLIPSLTPLGPLLGMGMEFEGVSQRCVLWVAVCAWATAPTTYGCEELSAEKLKRPCTSE